MTVPKYRSVAWSPDRTELTSLLTVLFVLLLLAALSCGGAEPEGAVDTVAPDAIQTLVPTPTDIAPPALTNLSGEGTWILESLDGVPTIKGSFVMVEIENDVAEGYDGCNWFGGRFEDGLRVADENGVFSFPSSARTLRLCEGPSGVMDQSDAFLSALGEGETYRATGERMEILDGDGDIRLVFVKQLPLPGRAVNLSGTAWRLAKSDGFANGQVDVATLAFIDDRLVVGDTACRPFLATYDRSEEGVRFPSHSMLERGMWQSCSDEERTLEGDFGDFLSSANEYAVQEEGGSIWLRMRSTTGETLTFEPLPPIVEGVSGTEWILVALTEMRQFKFGMWDNRTHKAVAVAELTLSFYGDGISGSTGCNSYGADATVRDGLVTIDAETYFYTELGCYDLEGVMEQEERYLDILPGMTRYGVYGDYLVMQTNDDVFLLFRAE